MTSLIQPADLRPPTCPSPRIQSPRPGFFVPYIVISVFLFYLKPGPAARHKRAQLGMAIALAFLNAPGLTHLLAAVTECLDPPEIRALAAVDSATSVAYDWLSHLRLSPREQAVIRALLNVLREHDPEVGLNFDDEPDVAAPR